MKIDDLLATRTTRMSGNAIREILKVTADPRIISLAGGLPSANAFPLEVINKLHAVVMKKYGSSAFQYAVTEGLQVLRDALIPYLKRKGITATANQIYVTSGSQGTLDAVGKTFISEGDKVAVEAPTYLGTMTAFNPYGPEYIEVDTDDEGIIPTELEKVLKEHKIKLVYLNPTFQNPTGRTLTLERRRAVAELLKKYDVLAVEDDPYGELRYRGKSVPSIKSMAPDKVIYTSTFSKIFAPGLRIGFFVAPEEVGQWLTFAKQGIDLHTNSYGQALAAEYLIGNYLEEHLPKIINLYRPRQEAMLNALEKYFPKEFKWTKPEGGMFIWIEGPRHIDAEKLYWEAIKEFVAFVPGKFFFSDQSKGLSTLRLNFTNTDEKSIEKAVKILGSVFKKAI